MHYIFSCEIQTIYNEIKGTEGKKNYVRLFLLFEFTTPNPAAVSSLTYSFKQK